MAVKAKPKTPEQIALPPEDVPFEDVVRKLLASPARHERGPIKTRAKKKANTSKRPRS